MADVASPKAPSLSEDYFLKAKEQEPVMAQKPAEEPEVKPSVDAPAEEIVQKTDETPSAADTVVEAASAATDSVVDAASAAADSAVDAASEVVAAVSDSAPEESNESSPAAEASEDATSAPSDESSDSAEPETEAEETPEIKLETAPADFRFPTTNQTRHCFTRYIEYHRCIAAKGDDAPECDKFAKYYRSLCPGEWVDRWNEQRENGTFPGPL